MAVIAESGSLLDGYVLDSSSKKPLDGAVIEVRNASDSNRLVISASTDDKGFYNISVQPGEYEVSAIVGGNNLTRLISLAPYQIQTLNFEIGTKPIFDEQAKSDPLFWVKVLIPAIIFLIFLFDRIVL
jgi:hypothetical protein